MSEAPTPGVSISTSKENKIKRLRDFVTEAFQKRTSACGKGHLACSREVAYEALAGEVVSAFTRHIDGAERLDSQSHDDVAFEALKAEVTETCSHYTAICDQLDATPCSEAPQPERKCSDDAADLQEQLKAAFELTPAFEVTPAATDECHCRRTLGDSEYRCTACKTEYHQSTTCIRGGEPQPERKYLHDYIKEKWAADEAARCEKAAPCFQICATDLSLYADCKVPGGARGDSGVDIRFPADVLVPTIAETNGIPVIIDLGVRARCSFRGEYEPYKLMPRSSVSKSPLEYLGGEIEGTPLKLANIVGIVDRGYQGPLKAAVRNHSGAPWQIRAGDAYFQLVRGDLLPACVSVVDASHPAFATVTVRGEGGFGSSGAGGIGRAPIAAAFGEKHIDITVADAAAPAVSEGASCLFVPMAMTYEPIGHTKVSKCVTVWEGADGNTCTVTPGLTVETLSSSYKPSEHANLPKWLTEGAMPTACSLCATPQTDGTTTADASPAK
jgi:dUTPase